MTQYKYDKSNNCLRQLPGMEKPEWKKEMPNWNEPNDTELINEWHRYGEALDNYTIHMNTLNPDPIPLSGDVDWEDGKIVEEGKDFELSYQVRVVGNFIPVSKMSYDESADEERRIIALPLPAKDDGVSGEEKNSEILKVAMALVRCGWQMACDEILLKCGDRPTWFTDILIEIMDKEKKRQFDWVKLRAEMEKMDIAHLMPKTKQS